MIQIIIKNPELVEPSSALDIYRTVKRFLPREVVETVMAYNSEGQAAEAIEYLIDYVFNDADILLLYLFTNVVKKYDRSRFELYYIAGCASGLNYQTFSNAMNNHLLWLIANAVMRCKEKFEEQVIMSNMLSDYTKRVLISNDIHTETLCASRWSALPDIWNMTHSSLREIYQWLEKDNMLDTA